MYLHGLLKEDGRTCHLTAIKSEGQLLRVTLFIQDAKRNSCSSNFLAVRWHVRPSSLIVGHGTCDTKLDHNRQ